MHRTDEAALKERYEAAKAAEKEATAPEDVSDIIEEHERKRGTTQLQRWYHQHGS